MLPQPTGKLGERGSTYTVLLARISPSHTPREGIRAARPGKGRLKEEHPPGTTAKHGPYARPPNEAVEPTARQKHKDGHHPQREDHLHPVAYTLHTTQMAE